jgi:SAM-dependent methyltransferase
VDDPVANRDQAAPWERRADAQTHDLGDGEFDAVFSKFGVMFFDDPGVAFANLRRSLRDGGRLGFVCWQDLFANEWMLVPGAAAFAVTGGPPPLPGPGRPGPFSLCDPALVADLLGSAGFADVDVSPMTDTVDLPADQLDDAVDASCGVGAAREALEATPDPALRDAIRRAVHDALAERVTDGRIRLAAAAHLVTARA